MIESVLPENALSHANLGLKIDQNGSKWLKMESREKIKKIENSPPSNVNKVISYHVMASDFVKNRPFRVKNGPKVVKNGPSGYKVTILESYSQF